ncbi:MAG: LptE family protein [Candidatus Eisenbacteria bacterium]
MPVLVNGRTQVLAAALVSVALAAASCAYTTSTALLPSHLKTVAVPVFENGTTEYTLEQDVTDAVIARFVADNHLRVVDERSADAVIKGRITVYKNVVFGFSQAAQAQEYRVTLTASVTFKDQVKNRELWSEPDLVKTANYYVVDTPGAPAKTELDGRKEAIAKLAEEIVARSVESW